MNKDRLMLYRVLSDFIHNKMSCKTFESNFSYLINGDAPELSEQEEDLFYDLADVVCYYSPDQEDQASGRSPTAVQVRQKAHEIYLKLLYDTPCSHDILRGSSRCCKDTQ